MCVQAAIIIATLTHFPSSILLRSVTFGVYLMEIFPPIICDNGGLSLAIPSVLMDR